MNDDHLAAVRGIINGLIMAAAFWGVMCAIGMLAYSCSARSTDWDTTDKVMFGSFIVLETIDAAQTWKIYQHPDQWQETNPIFGRNPNMAAVLGFKALATGAVYWVVKDSSSADRKLILGVLDAVQFSIVARNYSLGLKIGF